MPDRLLNLVVVTGGARLAVDVVTDDARLVFEAQLVATCIRKLADDDGNLKDNSYELARSM